MSAAERRAAAFAALGDPTRLALVAALAHGQPRSLTQLAGSRLTRQAVAKHLRVLEGAGLGRQREGGRETRFELRPAELAELRRYLDDVGQQWEAALARLKDFVETRDG